VKIINHAVDCVRKEEAHQTPLLKRTRYIFLKNEANLKTHERNKLEEIKLSKLNLKSLRALHIREAFQAIYQADTIENFKILLDKWYFRASHSRIPQMIEAAKTIKLHRD
jgi:transposase